MLSIAPSLHSPKRLSKSNLSLHIHHQKLKLTGQLQRLARKPIEPYHPSHKIIINKILVP